MFFFPTTNKAGVAILKINLAECVWNGTHPLPSLPERGKKKGEVEKKFNENFSEFPAGFIPLFCGHPLGSVVLVQGGRNQHGRGKVTLNYRFHILFAYLQVQENKSRNSPFNNS